MGTASGLIALQNCSEKVRQQYVIRPPHVFVRGRYIDKCIARSKLSRKKILFGWGKLRHGK